MSRPDLQLFGEKFWMSPYVFSSFVALTEKGLAFEHVELAFTEGEHLAAAYRDAALTARIPSLEHQGFRLTESSAIAEYLEEVFAPPLYPRLLPAELESRARARELMAWLRSDLGALRDERPSITMFFNVAVRPLSDAARRNVDKLFRIADALIPADGESLFGPWALVDSELAFMLHRLILNSDEVPARLATYAREQWQRPSVRAFVEHPRPREVPDSYWTISGTPKPV
jgi:glutathione S-transferase